jgi:Na+/H+ antiporter NhaC
VEDSNKRLEFRGGLYGLTIPFVVLFSGIMWLAFNGRALPMAFIVPTLAALFLALVLAKNPKECAEAIVQGMASEMIAIMLLAWFLAGIIAQLLKTTGLIQGLVWAGISVGLKGALFPFITFIIGCLVSTATGTVIGSIIALGPILFPVGLALGANPQAMIGAIVSGAYFGDNIAPVSDTTIASAYTLGTNVPTVVRTRLKYALAAASVAGVLFVILGGGGKLSGDNISFLGELKPKGLIMLAVPITLIFLMFKGVHLVVALMTTGVFGISLAVIAGLMSPSSILVVDMDSFKVGGLIADGINELVDVAIFALLLMGLVRLLERGGFLKKIVEKGKRFTKTPRSAEITITAITIIMNILTVASTIAIIMAGPLIRKITHTQKISPERRANILDAVSMAVMCVLPFSFGPLLAYMFASSSGAEIDFSLLSTIPYMFHGWALLGVMIFAVVTGWGREFMNEQAYKIESEKIKTSSLRR